MGAQPLQPSPPFRLDDTESKQQEFDRTVKEQKQALKDISSEGSALAVWQGQGGSLFWLTHTVARPLRETQ